MIKAIVFDLDGMVYLTAEMFTERYVREFEIDSEVLMPFFKNQLGECQLGEKDLKEELALVLNDWKWKGTVDELLSYWFEDGDVNFEMMKLVKDLQEQGIKCGLCTNNEKYRFEYLKRNFDLDNKFDFIITSYESGLKKPDPEIYKVIVKETRFSPDEIIVCDDRDKNVELIGSLGFETYVYSKFDYFVEYLKQLNILKI